MATSGRGPRLRQRAPTQLNVLAPVPERLICLSKSMRSVWSARQGLDALFSIPALRPDPAWASFRCKRGAVARVRSRAKARFLYCESAVNAERILITRLGDKWTRTCDTDSPNPTVHRSRKGTKPNRRTWQQR